MPPETTIAGWVYPAGSSRRTSATLSLTSDRAHLRDTGGILVGDYARAEIQFQAPIGTAARRAELPDGGLFETESFGVVDALSAGSLGQRLHVAERFSPRLFLLVGLTVLAGLALWRFALPALVWVAVALTPGPLKDLMDAGTLQSLDMVATGPTGLSVEQQDAAREIFDRVVSALPDDLSREDFALEFRSAPLLGPNAIALPGGTVILTDDLVRDFGEPDVIAGVIGHEIGHVVENHSLTQLYRSVGVYVLVALAAGDTGPIVEDILLEGNVILSLSYSRAHESAADDFGIRLADKAGYDPAGLIVFFEALPGADDTESGWGSTHPASGQRIEAIRDYVNSR